MRNLIQIALKCLFFSEKSKKLPSSWGFAPTTRYVICFSYTIVFSARCPIAAFFKQKLQFLWLIKPLLTNIRLQSVAQPKGLRELCLPFFSTILFFPMALKAFEMAPTEAKMFFFQEIAKIAQSLWQKRSQGGAIAHHPLAC